MLTGIDRPIDSTNATLKGRRRDRQGERVAAIAARSVKQHRTMIGFLAGAVLTLAALLLVVQNSHPVGLAWAVFDLNLPTGLTLVLTFAAGAVVGPIALGGLRHTQRKRREQLSTVQGATRKG